MQQFQARKDQFTTTRIVEAELDGPLNAGEIRVKVDSFSFTANNITYAATGDRIGYWQFFLPSGDDSEGWGVIPVWGFADVVESSIDEITTGERLFGYFPPATSLTLSPAKISDSSFFDGAAHRAKLPAGYNIYRRVAGEANYDPNFERERMLLYPLLITSFSLHDMLSSQDYLGAEQVLILSASSKTSIGLAYALADDDKAPAVIGITSAKNTDTVNALDLYSDVLSYDQLDQVDASKKTVIVDMSSDGTVLGSLHSRLGDNMLFTSNVGLTHWSEVGTGEGTIQERSELFFAPFHIQNRMKEWGPEVFEQRSSDFISQTALKCRSWLSMREIAGLQGLSDIYPEVCAGTGSPNEGLIIKM